MTLDAIIKRFENPDDTEDFDMGRFETVTLGGMVIGRATYEPGWRWSKHVGEKTGAPYCTVEHVGLVVSGTAAAAFEDGTTVMLTPGDLFYVPPRPHDSWVVGEDQYVSLHFLGADVYAKTPQD